jgi:hypothetical protein
MPHPLQDIVYLHGKMIMGDSYRYGDGWIAFQATLMDSGKVILVKRYTSKQASERKVVNQAFIESEK